MCNVTVIRCWLLLVLMMLKPAYGLDLSDPFDRMQDVSDSPAKNMLQETSVPCEHKVQLPKPLKLTDAIEFALCHNPQTNRAWLDVKAQAMAVGTSQSAYLPTLDVKTSINKLNRDSTFRDNPEFNTSPKSWDTDTSVSLNWVLYDFGLRAANLETARRLLSAANASQDQTLQEVFFNTAQAFYEVQAAQSLLEANTKAEQAAQKSLSAAEEKYTVGVGTLADKLQAQTSLAQLTTKRIQSEGDLQSAIGNLAMQMGFKPNVPLQLTGISEEFADDPSFLTAVDKLLEQATQEHPKILVAQAQLRAAQAKIEAVRAQGLPTLSFNAAEELYTTSATPINNQGSSEQMVETNRFGVQLSMPLFEGFGRQYKIRESMAQAEAKAAELSTIEQQISLDVWKSYQALRTETENLKATHALNMSASQSFDVAQGRYRSGVGNILELLKAQTDLASANQQRYLVITRWQTAKIRLAMNLGHLNMAAIS
jgi:outer membrane protein